MKKVLVEVIDIPVRYEGVTYYKGQTFQVLPDHVSNKFMKVMGEKSKDQTPISYEDKPLSLDKEGLEALSLDGLKDYASEMGIKLGRARTEEGIIEKILEAQKGE